MSTPFKDHFSTRSADYAAYRPTYPRALVDALADLSPATGAALDVGCGTGQLSVLLAERFARVIAADASAQQVGQRTPHPRVKCGAMRNYLQNIAFPRQRKIWAHMGQHLPRFGA